MLKKIIFCSALVAIIGCDDGFMKNRSENNTKIITPSSLKWAEVNRNTIRTAIQKHFIKTTPYPKEINENNNSINRERGRVNTEINKINRANKKTCFATASKNIKNEKKSHNIYADSIYKECIENLQKTDLFIDLKAKQTKIQLSYAAKSEHDRKLRKKADEAIEREIPKYAQKKGYQLIVNKYSSSVLYNSDKVVLDVTEDVIDYILNQDQP